MSLICLMGFLFSCTVKKRPEEESNVAMKMALMDADRAFSKLSETGGMKTAFLQYIDSNGVILRPGSLPLTGGNAIDYISQGNDTSFVMTWEPKGGSVAKSGDIGYTYGIYSIRPAHKDTLLHGTYVSVWKKQPDGKWKFVLDSGNDGVGE